VAAFIPAPQLNGRAQTVRPQSTDQKEDEQVIEALVRFRRWG
jgi:hypothetical protein